MNLFAQNGTGVLAITYACLAPEGIHIYSGSLYNSGLVLDSLCCLSNGLLSEVGSPLMSLNALYMYCCIVLPAASSASACKICTAHTESGVH